MGNKSTKPLKVDSNPSVDTRSVSSNYVPDEPEENIEEFKARQDHFAQIRSENLRNKGERERVQQAPNANTIVEEAVLEDLCQEADEELDSTKNGPMTSEQKAHLLKRISTNVRTKHHFESPDNFEAYVNEKLQGDLLTQNNLNIANTLQRNSSQISMTSQKRVSRLSNIGVTQRYSQRSMVSVHRVSSRMSQRSYNPMLGIGQRNSAMAMHGGPMAVLNELPETLPSGRVSNRDLTAHIRAQKGLAEPENPIRRTSSMTTNMYSLPEGFAGNDKSAMNKINRQKTQIVCKTNAQTLQMANTLAEKGTLEMADREVDSDDEFRCLCFYCHKVKS